MKKSPMRPAAFVLLLLPIIAGLAGCSRNPSLEISGSFFPAWMLSMLTGLIATFIARRIFVMLGVDPYLKPHLLVYGALALSFTLLTWLLVYL